MHPDLKALRERLRNRTTPAEVLIVQRLREHEERIAAWKGVLRGLEELEDKVKEQEELLAALE